MTSLPGSFPRSARFLICSYVSFIFSKRMRQLFVDSRDRVTGTTTDFTIQLPETLVIAEGSHRARIDNLRIPLAIPTIQTGINDTFLVQLGAQTYTITLPQGNVDGPTLASTLQGLLQAAAPGSWSVVYDTGNLALSVSCSNNFTIVGGTFADQIMTRPYTDTPLPMSRCWASISCTFHPRISLI